MFKSIPQMTLAKTYLLSSCGQTEEYLTVCHKLLIIIYKIFDSLLPTNAFPHPLFEPIENIVFFYAKFHICNIQTFF